MKKAIEKLKSAKAGLAEAQEFLSRETIKDMLIVVNALIDEAISLLQAPRWETPEQREKRTGEPWPDDWAVYYRYAGAHITYEGIYYDAFVGDWLVGVHRHIVRYYEEQQKEKSGRYQWVCATEAGPPPDDWEPEENNAAE